MRRRAAAACAFFACPGVPYAERNIFSQSTVSVLFLSTIMRYNKNINRSVRLWEETKMANEKILVVDDDKNICELLRLYLV